MPCQGGKWFAARQAQGIIMYESRRGSREERGRAQVSIKIGVAADRRSAEIVFDNTAMRLDASQIDELVAALAGVRSNLEPAVPEQFPQDMPTHRHESNRYFFGLDPVAQMPVLAFRSPAFGWLSFLLSFEEAQKIGAQMQAAQDRQPDTSRPN